MKSAKIMAVVAALGVLSVSAFATTVGYVDQSFAVGTNVASVTFKNVASLENGPSSGAITGATATTVTIGSAGWDAPFVTAAQPYFVRFTSGSATGRTIQISTNTSDTLTLSTGGADLVNDYGVTTGDNIEILYGETLGTLFATIAVNSGANQSASDNVLLFTGTVWNTYWFDGTNWRQGSSPSPRNNIVINPDSGFLYVNKGASAISFVDSGTVPDVDSKINLSSGTTFATAMYPVDRTIGSLGLETTSGWISETGSNNGAGADRFLYFNGSIWGSYYYDSNLGYWRSGPSPANRNGIVISAGTPLLIVKTSAAAEYSPAKPY
jgi:hypothetical protein